MTGPDRPTHTILLIGAFDTKSAELVYLADQIRAQGAQVMSMDVSVLGEPGCVVDIDKHAVARAADSSIDAAVASGDENSAMQIMARGSARLTAQLQHQGRIDAMIALGGTMGTDLALDCANALPLGVPKLIVSTIAFSPLIPPERLPADAQMMLWAGGLHGLNSICRTTLSQAAGAVLGAARAVERSPGHRPVVGITSLGSSCLNYMVTLKPALESRGFEVAIFHSTGMGGRAFESLAAQGAFVCVMDFCLQELSNEVHGSPVTGGAGRLTAAGLAGVPQLVAPGACDLIDLPTWQVTPDRWANRTRHIHNRLIASIVASPAERQTTAQAIAGRLAMARAPVHLILPMQGIEQWDRPGEPLHDATGLQALMAALLARVEPPVDISRLDAHINDRSFVDHVLALFDRWVNDGIVVRNPSSMRPGTDSL